MENPVRVRFAPSPTGLLHLGNARTALFNWLFARHHGGCFILRLEDTDQARHEPAAERGIYVSLKWLGLEWDEGPVSYHGFREPGPGAHGPYRQSGRGEFYRRYLLELESRGMAYPCFCTPEEIEQERREMARRGLVYRYSGKCSRLSSAEVQARLAEGRRPVWRFKSGTSEVSWTDVVRGRTAWSAAQLDDFVLMRPAGRPTYNFAAVVDDHLMDISHVIRGDDHLANTPKQLLLYHALGWDPPQFAHLPLITGPDHKPLAKRHGIGSLDDLYQQGFLPPAIVNYLALLGWSSPSGAEILDRNALIQQFSLARVNRSPAVFDQKKLRWINAKYLRNMTLDELSAAVKPYLQNAGLHPSDLHPDLLLSALHAVQDNLKTCADAVEKLKIFLAEPLPFQKEARRILASEKAQAVLRELEADLRASPEMDQPGFAALLAELGEKTLLHGPDLYLPIRAALTGQLHGPDLATIMAVLKKQKILERLAKARQISA